MTTVNDFTDRARKAKRARELETDTDMGFAEIGVEIGRVLHTRPVQAGTVRRWFRDVVPSDLDTLWAMAIVLNVDAGWLTFGERCSAPQPSWFTPRPPASDESDDHLRNGAVEQARRQLGAIRRAGRQHRRGKSA